MFKIRIHGRGGQGGATLAVYLAKILFFEFKGKVNVQASQEFTPARRLAPVKAGVRFGKEKNFERGDISDPDAVIVLDDVLKGYTSGLKEGGLIVINSKKKPSEIVSSAGKKFVVVSVNADAIARELKLGDKRFPFINTAMLGAFIVASGLAGKESFFAVLESEFGEKAELNKLAAFKARDSILVERRTGKDAGTKKE